MIMSPSVSKVTMIIRAVRLLSSVFFIFLVERAAVVAIMLVRHSRSTAVCLVMFLMFMLACFFKIGIASVSVCRIASANVKKANSLNQTW